MRTTSSAPPLYRMPAATIQTRQQYFWKYIQAACWMLAIVELFLLWLSPQTGIMILWNILIPLAPAMLVLNTGLWRNLCPLGTSSLIADKLGLSGKKNLTVGQSTCLNLAGIVLLMLIIPLRHIWFNTGGRASAALLAGTGAFALFSGFLFERKSGWCSGACPVHPVEKLYGSGVAATGINAHCSLCVKCVTPCPDSTPNIGVRSLKGSAISAVNEILMAGCFPGYVWGWFQVPDYPGRFEWHNLFVTYGYPAIRAIVSLTLFLLARQLFPKTRTQQVTRFFGALAISVYYWFRLPMILGFASTENNGAIAALNHSVPGWAVRLLTVATSGFFFWRMVFRTREKKSWLKRPKYAHAKRHNGRVPQDMTEITRRPH